MSIENPLAGKRILVVEDEMLAAMELTDILESRDCKVVGPVASLKDALPMARASDYDAAVLDISLRDGVVFPLADWLRDQNVPFIFATAYESSTGLTHEFSEYPIVPKPYPERRLVRELGKVLTAHQA